MDSGGFLALALWLDSILVVLCVNLGILSLVGSRKVEVGGSMSPKTRLLEDDRGQTNAASRAVNTIVSLTVVGLVSAYLLPVAINDVVAVDTTGWSGGAAEIWGILDLVIVLAIFLVMIGIALKET